MTLRKVPGPLTLGLLASLAAHAGLYGTGHAMGGTYHGLLLQIALAGLLGLIAFFGGLAWGEAGSTSDGTVLAARLRERLPNRAVVLLSAASWYVIGESVEPGHAAASLVASLAALLLASFVVAWFARVVTGAIARAVLTVARTLFSPRVPSWGRAQRTPARRRALHSRRRFARPPPIALAFSHA